MDNDLGMKKLLASAYRNARFFLDYHAMGVLSEQEGNDTIKNLLLSKAPFMVGRFGAVEMHLVSRWMKREAYAAEEVKQAQYAAGIFPNDFATLSHFCEVYTEAMRGCDFIGAWEVPAEKAAIKAFCGSPVIAPSRSIEPYYHERPWSKELTEKKVLIVHPFVKTIEGQLKKREKIWPGKDILPAFSANYVRTVQSNAGGQTAFKDWFEALDYQKRQISEKEFDVAIIGAGAYGLPLAAYVKSLGKQAIQMSGATQILFGIKGKRWDSHPVISKFYNEAWTRASAEETPPRTDKVEGGSYW